MRSKWSWAALALVAVLGITTAASATTRGLITGKQIAPHTISSKNLVDHTIQGHDLSRKLIKSLHGARGATGPAGPPGPTSLWVYLSNRGDPAGGFVVPAGTTQQIWGGCGAGDVAVGGSFVLTQGDHALVHVFGSAPPSGAAGATWQLWVDNSGSTDAVVEMHAVCLTTAQ